MAESAKKRAAPNTGIRRTGETVVNTAVLGAERKPGEVLHVVGHLVGNVSRG